MKSKFIFFSFVFVVSASPSFAQSNPLYIQFRPGVVKGALCKPDRGPAPHVGILVMHRTANVLSQLPTSELSSKVLFPEQQRFFGRGRRG